MLENRKEDRRIFRASYIKSLKKGSFHARTGGLLDTFSILKTRACR